MRVCAHVRSAQALTSLNAESGAANPPKKKEDIAIAVCYEDASTKGNQCGEDHKATCTTSGGAGECCSAGGWCGSDATFCGPDMQVEFSHGENLCEDGMATDGFVAPVDDRAAEQQQQEQQSAPWSCYTDANVGSMQCGPTVHATCTGSSVADSKCCSSAGYCGSGDAFCGDGMQKEYSHGNNLCEPAATVGQQAEGHQGDGQQGGARAKNVKPKSEKPHCLTVEQVAKAWVNGISPLSKADAKAMCVPAVIIAAGSAYHLNTDGWTSPCEDKFDPLVEADGWDGKRKGLWQISEQFFDSADPTKQAKVAYEVYTSDNSTNGCLAEWCITSTPGCSAVIPGIGEEDAAVTASHRFCMGVWSGANTAVPVKLQAMAVAAGTEGGQEVVEAACANALKHLR